MKRYVYSASNSEKERFKVYAPHIPYEEWKYELEIEPSEVRPKIFDNIKEEDKELFKYLFKNKCIPSITNSKDLRCNPYYDLEDKFVKLLSDNGDSRTYTIPYEGNGRFGSGRIFLSELTVKDDGNVVFESGKEIDPMSVQPRTFRKYL